MLYRSREDLQEAYPDPYSVADADNSYKRWCELTGETLAPGIDTQVETVEALKNHLMQTYGELAYIKNSKTWRWMQAIRRLLGKEPMRYSG